MWISSQSTVTLSGTSFRRNPFPSAVRIVENAYINSEEDLNDWWSFMWFVEKIRSSQLFLIGRVETEVLYPCFFICEN